MKRPPRPTPAARGIDSTYIATTEHISPTVVERIFTVLSIIAVIITFPLSMLVCLTILPEYQRLIVFRLGRLKKGGALGPGIVFILPCIDYIVRVDLRTSAYDVPAQEILTKDSVTVQLDAVVYYRINNPLKSVIQVRNVREATHLLAQTTLRNIAGTKNLENLMADRESISQAISKILDEGTFWWGVKVERVEIKDVRLPLALQKALAAEAEAGREAQAKIVAAEGELNAARALKEASDVMSSNPVALQLRYLQTLNTISNRQTKNIIFPLPIDLLTNCSCLGPCTM